MEVGLYVLIEAFCVTILIILGYNSKRQLSRILDDRLFLEVILASAIMLIADMVWRLVEGVQLPGFRVINIIASGIFMLMTGVIGFIWVVYVDCKIEYNRKKLKLRSMLYSVFSLVLTILTVTSPWTKAIYYIDENNCYHRGKFYLIQVMVGFIYLISSTIIALFETNNIKILRKRKEVSRIPLFAFAPTIGGLLQVYFSRLPTVVVGITLSLLFIYVNLQNKQLSRDALTGVYNRWHLNRYLDNMLSDKKREKFIFFILIDIDKFKIINDTYGHLEGDNAIIRVADILTSVCDSRSDFLARFGGDEFAIVCERKNVSDVEKLKNDINKAIEMENENSEGLYNLSLSMGSAQFFVDGFDTQDEVIYQADQRLYEVKKEKAVL